MANDWNKVRYELDKSDNFHEIFNSPWYSDVVYEKFSDAEFARRHDAARKLMARDKLDALILCGSPNIYSHGSGVTWGAGLIDDRGMCQYMVLPREGDPTLIYPHPGCHIEAVRKAASTAFRQRGAQSRPICMHGLDLITSLPFISVDEVKSEPFDMTMQPGMTYSIEITPVNADGTFGIFFSRSYAITDSGVQELTPFPLDEIIVGGE